MSERAAAWLVTVSVFGAELIMVFVVYIKRIHITTESLNPSMPYQESYMYPCVVCEHAC